MESKILSNSECTKIVQRFPSIELSYETISHKKVSPSYELALAIPQGKKFYAWFSFYENKDVLYLMEINKEKKITNILMVPVPNFDQELFFGTVFYGVVLLNEPTVDSPIFPQNNQKKRFIIEDMLNYRGISMKKMKLNEKMPWMFDFLNNWKQHYDASSCEADFFMPAMWHYDTTREPEGSESVLPVNYKNLPYQVHHIQYRCLYETAPYLNYPITKNFCSKTTSSTSVAKPVIFENFKPNFAKPQYKNKTVFVVNADIQFDIYHLYAYGKNKSQVYYNVAYIPNYKTSVFMNNLFRNIKENKNLDYIEESDDEDDFQNTAVDKYVNLQKTLYLECKFHPKFKKWVPLRVVNPQNTVVHISML